MFADLNSVCALIFHSRPLMQHFKQLNCLINLDFCQLTDKHDVALFDVRFDVS